MNSSNYLEHHGIKGMKWGIRRYQNADGSLTDAGRKHYGKEIQRAEVKRSNNLYSQRKGPTSNRALYNKQVDIFNSELKKSREYKDYAKARDQLEEYEIDNIDDDVAFRSKKYQKLKEAEQNKAGIYQKKINEVYADHESEILTAKLSDLKLPTNSNYQQIYKDYKQTRVSQLGYDSENWLSLLGA